MSQTTNTINLRDDEKANRQTSLDYMEDWYQGVTERICRSLRPSLVKRTLRKDAPAGRAYLNYLT